MTSGLVPKEINHTVIPEYFTFRYVSDKNTLIANIYSLLPGYYLCIECNKSINVKKYWESENSFRNTHNGNQKTIVCNIITNLKNINTVSID